MTVHLIDGPKNCILGSMRPDDPEFAHHVQNIEFQVLQEAGTGETQTRARCKLCNRGWLVMPILNEKEMIEAKKAALEEMIAEPETEEVKIADSERQQAKTGEDPPNG